MTDSIVFVLDTSGSMAMSEGSRTRIAQLAEVLQQVLPKAAWRPRRGLQ